MNPNLKMRMIIIDSKREEEWRVIYTNVDSTVLCQTNTSKLILKTVNTNSILLSIDNQ